MASQVVVFPTQTKRASPGSTDLLILQCLEDGPRDRRELRRELAVHRNSWARAERRLVDAGLVVRKGSTLHLPGRAKVQREGAQSSSVAAGQGEPSDELLLLRWLVRQLGEDPQRIIAEARRTLEGAGDVTTKVQNAPSDTREGASAKVQSAPSADHEGAGNAPMKVHEGANLRPIAPTKVQNIALCTNEGADSSEGAPSTDREGAECTIVHHQPTTKVQNAPSCTVEGAPALARGGARYHASLLSCFLASSKQAGEAEGAGRAPQGGTPATPPPVIVSDGPNGRRGQELDWLKVAWKHAYGQVFSSTAPRIKGLGIEDVEGMSRAEIEARVKAYFADPNARRNGYPTGYLVAGWHTTYAELGAIPRQSAAAAPAEQEAPAEPSYTPVPEGDLLYHSFPKLAEDVRRATTAADYDQLWRLAKAYERDGTLVVYAWADLDRELIQESGLLPLVWDGPIEVRVNYDQR